LELIMLEEKLKELRDADATPETLVELGELARLAGDDPRLVTFARAIEASHARWLGKHQHAVVAGAEILEAWPKLRAIPRVKDEKDALDLPRRVVWGMKYVAGSAMDLPEIPLATTDGVLATLGEMLEHFEYEPFALWTLQGRRAFIAGDDLRDIAKKIAPTITRYNHVYECADCPGCIYLQLVEWMGPEASDTDVEEVLAPVLGKKPFLPDPEGMGKLLDLLYGEAGSCENADRTAPVRLSRAYLHAGRKAEALREAKRAVAMAEGTEAERRARAHVARVAVAHAMKEKDAKELAAALVETASSLEDAYEQLDAFLVAYAVLHDPSLAKTAQALAERLDARVEKKRHVAATQAALG
jgi:hypothetical protein